MMVGGWPTAPCRCSQEGATLRLFGSASGTPHPGRSSAQAAPRHQQLPILSLCTDLLQGATNNVVKKKIKKLFDNYEENLCFLVWTFIVLPQSSKILLLPQEPKFGMLMETLKSPLTRLEDVLSKEALELFNMVSWLADNQHRRSKEVQLTVTNVFLFCFQVLRFMGDPHLNGAQENMFGNYIIQRGLSSPGLRDEIIAQVVNQVWRNVNTDNAERGWLLLLACVCSFAPSPRMDKYLLK